MIHTSVSAMFARRFLAPALLAALSFSALPAVAETVDAGSQEARVDRLLWQLINDDRYGHLQIAANYERLRARLLEQNCLVSAAPCLHVERLQHQGQMMTTEITPEQAELVEQLLFTLHSASASTVMTPSRLLISASE